MTAAPPAWFGRLLTELLELNNPDVHRIVEARVPADVLQSALRSASRRSKR